MVERGLEAFRQFAPWTTKGPLPIDDDVEFVASTPAGSSLWERVRDRVPPSTRRILIAGPYFDTQLEFISLLRDAYPDAKLVVAVQPDRVALNVDRARALKARFVDAQPIADERGGADRFLHGKALYFEGQKEALLIAGSANPSSAAWLGAPGKRNAEAVVLRKGGEASVLARELGLTDLFDAPALQEKAWKAIRAPEQDRANSTKSSEGSLLFRHTGDELICDDAASSRYETCVLLDEEGTEVGSGHLERSGTTLRFKGEGVDRVRLLTLQTSQGQLGWGIAHHDVSLADRALPGAQRRLRTALGGLDGDPTMLEQLLPLVDKVIFENMDVERTLHRTAASAPRVDSKSAPGAGTRSLLGPDPEEIARAKQARKLSSGDLAILLDAVLRQLAMPSTPRPDTGATEEELVGSEEPALVNDELVREPKLAALCRGKVRQLFARLQKRLEAVYGGDGVGAEHAVNQTAAVLGLVRALRRAEERDPWRKARLQLVDPSLAEAFVQLTFQLGGSEGSVFDLAVQQAEGEYHELVQARVLLGWLAWDAKIGFETCVEDEETSALEKAVRRAALACVAQAICADAEHVRLLRECIAGASTRAIASEEWIDSLRRFAERLSAPVQAPGGLIVGDLAVTKTAPQRVLVVLELHDNKVVLSDPGTTEGSRTYQQQFVRRIGGMSLDDPPREALR